MRELDKQDGNLENVIENYYISEHAKEKIYF